MTENADRGFVLWLPGGGFARISRAHLDNFGWRGWTGSEVLKLLYRHKTSSPLC